MSDQQKKSISPDLGQKKIRKKSLAENVTPLQIRRLNSSLDPINEESLRKFVRSPMNDPLHHSDSESEDDSPDRRIFRGHRSSVSLSGMSTFKRKRKVSSISRGSEVRFYSSQNLEPETPSLSTPNLFLPSPKTAISEKKFSLSPSREESKTLPSSPIDMDTIEIKIESPSPELKPTLPMEEVVLEQKSKGKMTDMPIQKPKDVYQKQFPGQRRESSPEIGHFYQKYSPQLHHVMSADQITDEHSTMGSFIGTGKNPLSIQRPGSLNGSMPSILSKDLFKNPNANKNYRPYHSYQRVKPLVDSEDEDDHDDAISVLEEAAKEERHRVLTHDNANGMFDVNNFKFFFRWLWKFIKFVLLAALFIAPGFICKFYISNQCTYNTVPMFHILFFTGSIIFGYFFADFVVMLGMLLIKRTPYLGIQFIYYINTLGSPLKWFIFFLIVQTAWPLFVFTPPISDNQTFLNVYNVLNNIISCALVTSGCFLGKAFILRLIAVNFHRGAYYKRIKNALLSEYVLTCLFQSRPKQNPVSKLVNTLRDLKSNFNPNVKKESRKPFWYSWFHEEPDLIVNTLPITEKELLDKRPFSNHKLATYVEFIKHNELTFYSGIFKDTILAYRNQTEHQDLFFDKNEKEFLSISNSQAAKIISRTVFDKFKKEEIMRSDFELYMSPEFANLGFALFDGNWDGSLSEEEFYTTLLSISRERKALKTALNDAESAISKLDAALTGVLWLILVVIFFILFGNDPQKVLVTLSSFLLASAFAISSSAKALLESIVFIFISHPYDIGDRVVIDSIVYTVTKMSLLTSELKRYDNAIVYFSNSVLSSKPILNLRRSPDQFDLVNIQISFHTPSSILRKLESKISDYLSKRTNHFYRKFEVEYKEVENTNRLLLRIWVQHRNNFQNMRRYRERRGRLILRIKKICEELGVDYELPIQRLIYDGLPAEASFPNVDNPDWNISANTLPYAALPPHFAQNSGNLGHQPEKASEHYQDRLFNNDNGPSPYSVQAGILDRDGMQHVRQRMEKKKEDTRIEQLRKQHQNL